MTVSDNGIKFICSFEGFSPTPYADPASGGEPITIAYGTTHYPDGTKVTMDDPPVTEKQGQDFVRAYLPPVEEWLTNNVPGLNTNQFDACADFCYNEGLHNFEISQLEKDVVLHGSNPTLLQDFENWIKAAGHVMKGLQNRREAEYQLFIS